MGEREEEGGRGRGGETDHLGDDGDVGAQGVEVERVRREAVVQDGAFGEDASEERECQGALRRCQCSAVRWVGWGRTFPLPVRPTMPTRSPEATSNEMSCRTFGPSCECCEALRGVVWVSVRTGEYRAERFSTTRCPLAGQYADGTPSGVGFGSCSTDRYCCMRSKLLPSRQSGRCKDDISDGGSRCTHH